MKSWSYYSVPEVPYFGHHERKTYRLELIDKINEKLMTGAEREKALAAVDRLVFEHAKEQNKPYHEEEKRLKKEFWEDARQEFGYTEFLSDEGVSILESKAWDEGHSYGYSEVYNCLTDLVDFTRRIIKASRPDKA